MFKLQLVADHHGPVFLLATDYHLAADHHGPHNYKKVLTPYIFNEIALITVDMPVQRNI